MHHPVLILGGTTEARLLAGRLAGRADVMLSLAGRTANPVAQPAPVRVGGFGGPAGLARYMREKDIALLVDATHPYAARISANAAQAAAQIGVPLIALRRPAWNAVQGDRWTHVADVEAAVAALGQTPRNVFVALGRNEVAPFEAAPHHRYLIRSVDPIEPPLNVPRAVYVLARGPFALPDERTLLERHAIDAVICKNSGGDAAYGKIAAARELRVEVVMLRRPALPDAPSGETVDAVLAMALHALGFPAERGA